MARIEHEGTSRELRSKGYVFPSRRRRVLAWSLAAAGIVSIGLPGGYFAGVRRTLSPGMVASHHARIDLKCVQCHEPGHAVTAVRCERCHDPIGSERLTQAAHVLLGTGDIRKAETSSEPACATCHTEHRGLTASLRAVDNRECATCHTFATLGRHPEFAAVRAQATAAVGLKFNHDRHLVEAERTRGATCALCHEQTADRTGFVPMSFDRHCASCHAPSGVFADSDPILGDLLVPPAALPASWRARTAAVLQPRGRKQVASQLRHRDGWVMFNALRIRQSIDRDGEAAERLALRGRIAYLEQLLAVKPVHTASADEIEAAVTALEADLGALDAELARATASDADAIRDMLNAAQALARQMTAVDPGAGAATQAIGDAGLGASVAPPPIVDPDSAARFDRRKAELLKLLDTVAARSVDERVKQRAAALRAEVDRLAPSGAAATDDSGALLEQLSALDAGLSALRTIPDPGLQSQLSQIDVLRAYGQQRIGAGLSPADFETRKTELLALLDTIERRGGPAIRVRVGPLRQRVLALRPGSIGDLDARRSRRQRQKQLERLRLELELQRSGDQYEPAPAQDARLDPVSIAATLQQLRAQLADLERAPRMSAAQSAEEREQRRNELDALLSRCLKCHDYDPSGVVMARVRAAEPVMPHSVFNHAPHTTQTGCETCHGPTRTSKLATDINVPGVSNCRTCHAPSRARAECETCHVYHPASPAKLLEVSR